MENFVFCIVFSICLVLVIVGYYVSEPVILIIATFATIIMEWCISKVLNEIDTQGQGLRLWYQRLKYYKKEVRLSFSYLFRIQVDGKYLLVKGNRLKNQYQPVGGVYKYYTEAKPVLESFNYKSDVKMGNAKETDDLRIFIKGKYLLSFMNWFLAMKDREYDPIREFKEELIETGLLSKEKFEKLVYRKVNVHNKGVRYSKYMQCEEFVYADIFELKLTEEQEQEIRNAVKKRPELLCLATVDELKSECYSGIQKNLGNNSKWIIGEE